MGYLLVIPDEMDKPQDVAEDLVRVVMNTGIAAKAVVDDVDMIVKPGTFKTPAKVLEEWERDVKINSYPKDYWDGK